MFRLSSTMCHFVAVGSTSDRVLQMGEGILFRAGGSPRRVDDLTRDDIEIDEPGQGAMSDVLEFTREPHGWVASGGRDVYRKPSGKAPVIHPGDEPPFLIKAQGSGGDQEQLLFGGLDCEQELCYDLE